MYTMDFHGQKCAEFTAQVLIVTGFVLGTAYGWITQSLEYALYGWLGTFALALILCVPAWPWYCKHPVKWLPVPEDEDDDETSEDEPESEVLLKGEDKEPSNLRKRN